MTGTAGLVLCPDARIYDHGPRHPLRPQRVLYTWALIDACGLLDDPNVTRIACRTAGDAEIELVHDAAFVDATRRAGHGEDGAWARFGYGPSGRAVLRNVAGGLFAMAITYAIGSALGAHV